MRYRSITAALFGAAWILAGCTTINPPVPVPAPMAETMPKPPVSAEPLIWQPGHWDWTGNAYVWIPGPVRAGRGAQQSMDVGLLGTDRFRPGVAPGALDVALADAARRRR